MAQPTHSTVSDPATLFAKKLWEDPYLTLERGLEVKAQGGPSGDGAPDFSPNAGFLGTLNVSAVSSDQGFC